MNVVRNVLTAAILAIVPLAAGAATTTFSDRSSFQSAATSLTTEGFNDPFAIAASVDFGTLVMSSDVVGRLSSHTFPATVSEGARSVGFSENDVLTFEFGAAINAIGFDINEMNTGGMSYADNGGNTVNNATADLNSFFGLISSMSFTKVTLTFSGLAGRAAGIDYVEFGDAPALVPLPASLPLLVAGFSGLMVVARRRRDSV